MLAYSQHQEVRKWGFLISLVILAVCLRGKCHLTPVGRDCRGRLQRPHNDKVRDSTRGATPLAGLGVPPILIQIPPRLGGRGLNNLFSGET
jgi:hypothetical protein